MASRHERPTDFPASARDAILDGALLAEAGKWNYGVIDNAWAGHLTILNDGPRGTMTAFDGTEIGYEVELAPPVDHANMGK